MARDLARIVRAEHVLAGDTSPYCQDATYETLGLRGRADAVVRPADAEQVRAVVAWCYQRDVAIVPRGGGSGYAGGAVPTLGGVVVSLERLREVRSLNAGCWNAEMQAGVSTATVARLARENGLLFAPNPGAMEQSHIGGNVATNAGGPRAFKYGTTGRWVTGVEAVIAPGELMRVGGPVRKDVAGYDLRGLLVGSEGTLGIITSVWLRFVPAPPTSCSLLALYPDTATGCAAIERVIASGVQPAALEYADEGAMRAARAGYPGEPPPPECFLVLAELDGTAEEVAAARREATALLGEDALRIDTVSTPAAARELWRWRGGWGPAITAIRGGRVSEDVVVPGERLAELITGVVAIGARHGLPACSIGHAGDANIHGCFLLAPGDEQELARAVIASSDLCDLAIELGGSMSGEHGIGWVKRGRLERQLGAGGMRLHAVVKHALDPKGLLNPGKKT